MSSSPTTGPRRTALDALHRSLGATMTDFAGWDMPLRYGSERDEHLAEEMGHEAHARRIWEEMEEARDRAEAMGDRVEPGTRETGTGSRSSQE